MRIINGGTSKKNIEFFNKKVIKVDDFSIWRTEELLPITVLQKSMIERDSIVEVSLWCLNLNPSGQIMSSSSSNGYNGLNYGIRPVIYIDIAK